MVSFIQICSGVKSFVYGLPRQYDECIKHVLNEAASKGLAVQDLHTYCGDLPLYQDGVHFREDSESRRKMLAGIAHGLHLRIAEEYAKAAITADAEAFYRLQRSHTFDTSGKYLMDTRQLTESLKLLSRPRPTKPINAEEHQEPDAEVDPWEDLYYEDKRKARHDSLPDLTPEDIERGNGGCSVLCSCACRR